MPRRNTSKSVKGGSGRRRSPKADPFPIDWERASRLHAGEDPDSVHEPRRTATPRTQTEEPRNEFTRRLTGFSESALELMLRYGFKHIDENGAPVRFQGISAKPTKRIACEKPGIVISRGGLVVVSGLVGTADREDIGLGESGGITRIDGEPELDSHNSAGRFNVALGRRPEGVKEHDLARELLGDSAISLSRVVEVNGHVITPEHTPWEIDEYWNRRESEPSFGIGSGSWDEPPRDMSSW